MRSHPGAGLPAEKARIRSHDARPSQTFDFRKPEGRRSGGMGRIRQHKILPVVCLFTKILKKFLFFCLFRRLLRRSVCYNISVSQKFRPEPGLGVADLEYYVYDQKSGMAVSGSAGEIQ